jgi:hypothetical protein
MVQSRVTLRRRLSCRKVVTATSLLPKPAGQSVTLLPDGLNHAGTQGVVAPQVSVRLALALRTLSANLRRRGQWHSGSD